MCNHRGAYKCTSYNPKQMRKERIYIICPLNVPIHTLQSIATKARSKKNVEVTYYERGTAYSRENLEKADSVIIILPRATFKCGIGELLNGSYQELLYSIENKKPIYLGYIALSGPNIYEFDYSDEKYMTGIAGTTTKFFSDINIKEESKVEISKYRFKTAQEFASEGRWSRVSLHLPCVPENWEEEGDMNHFLGQDIPNEYNLLIDNSIKERTEFKYDEWIFSEIDVVLKNPPQSEMIDLRKKVASQEQINIVIGSNSVSAIYTKSPYISSVTAYKEEELLLLLL